MLRYCKGILTLWGYGNEWHMSNITEIIDTLEERIGMLVQKIDRMEQTIAGLKKEIGESAKTIENQTNEITSLKSAYETLKVANSLLGSDENKRETKLKINSLIREIDYCIAQLAD